MKNMKTRSGVYTGIVRAGIFTALAAILMTPGLFLSCENPIRAGLGPRVDIRGPTVNLENPVIGQYIADEVLFTGTAEDDIEVKSVEIKLADGNYEAAEFNAAEGTWSYTVNTNQFPDGDFKVKLRVFDLENKRSETNELAFIVKNGRPNLEMLIPAIKLFDESNPKPVSFNDGPARALDTGGELKGLALDMRGIDTTNADLSKQPRIRFWPVSEYSTGVPPENAPPKYRWLKIPNDDIDSGLASANFSWPLNERDDAGNLLADQNLEAGQAYRFQVEITSNDGKNFIYPQDLYSDAELTARPENRYVEIYLETTREFPLIDLAPSVSNPPQPHNLITGLTSFKRGPFELRIKASHSRGVQSAEIWYTREGETEKHTLAWDVPAGEPETDPSKPPAKYFTYTAPPDYFAEGNYTLTVKATGGGGSYTERDYSIRIDRTVPEITLNEVKGSAGFEPAPADGSGFNRYTVNGVIEPRALIADPLSGLNTGTDGLREQQWFVADQTNHDIIAARAGSEPLWYPSPGTDTGYTVKAGGVIGDSGAFKIDTEDSANGLADKTNYYLYIFARDKAYKVNRETCVLRVDQDSDKPAFDFTVGTINPEVKYPNYPYLDAADDPDPVLDLDYAGDPGQNQRFELREGGSITVRNRLSSAGTIKLRLLDDDGLDLSTLKIFVAGSQLNSSNKIEVIDPPALVAAGSSFGTNPAEALLSRTGEITQRQLRDALGQTGGNVNALNDGIYRLSLEVKDRPQDKGKMDETDPDDPDAAVSDTLYFWFAVDSVNPRIISVSPPENNYFGVSGENPVRVVIQDKNAPIYPTLEIYLQQGINYVPWENLRDDVDPPLDFTVSDPNIISIAPAAADPSIFEYTVEFTVNMANYPGGEPRLMVGAADRFANTAVFTRTLRIDTAPPTAALTNFTKTLSRYDDGKEYVNGVVSFTISAGDNYGLEGITWWLWPANLTFPPVPAGLTGAWDLGVYNPSDPLNPLNMPEGAMRGYISASARPYRAYADTRLLKDKTEYHLYIAARDQAQNYSLGNSTPVKTLMVDQSTDKPTWEVHNNIRPQNVVGSEGWLLNGILADDDGFNVSGGPVKIRVASSPDRGDTWGSWSSWVTIPTANLTAAASTLTINNFNLNTTFSGFLTLDGTETGAPVDGYKRYQLLYKDARDNKFTSGLPEGLAPDEDHVFGFADETNYATISDPNDPEYPKYPADKDVFYFVNDNAAPDITIAFYEGSNPNNTANTVYGKGSVFRVQGTVTELNLLRDMNEKIPGTTTDNPEYGNYYIKYSVDGSDPKMIYIPYTAADKDNPNKTWELPDAEAAAIFAALPDQLHTLTITAEDGTPKTASRQGTFFKDTTAPEIKFDTISSSVTLPYSQSAEEGIPYTVGTKTYYLDWYVNPLDSDPAGDGTGAGKDDDLLDTDAKRNAWYQAQDDWINERDGSNNLIRALTTIPFLASQTPVLTGTFVDENSDIQNNLLPANQNKTFQYKFDNDPSWHVGNIAGAGKVVQWSIPLTDTGGKVLADGIHSVSIRVSDLTGNPTLPLYDQGAEGPDDNDLYERFAFRMDRTAPEQTAASLSEGAIYGKISGSALPGDTVFRVSGKIDDPNLRSLSLSIFKGSEPAARHVKDILLSPSTDTSLTRTWDRAIELIASNGISGGYRQVTKEELTWEYRVSASDYSSLSTPDGTDYVVKILALDSGGGETLVELPFTIDKTSPEVEIGNFGAGQARTMNAEEAAAYNTVEKIKTGNKMNYIYSSNPRITGTAKDFNLMTNLSALESRLSQWDGSGWALILTEDWIPLQDSTGAALIDPSAGRTGTSVNWTKYLGLESFGSDLADGLYLLEIRARDSAWPGYPDTSILKGNPAAGIAAAFYIDRQMPVLELDEDTQGKIYYSNNPDTNDSGEDSGKLIFTGTASDANGIMSLTGRLKEDISYETDDVTWIGNNWTLKIPAPTDATDVYAGKSYTLQLTLTDNAEQKRPVLEKVFTLDNKLPEASVKTPETGHDVVKNTYTTVTGPTTIEGVSSDRSGSGIYALDYYLGPYTENRPGPDAAWRPLGGDGDSWDPHEFTDANGTTSTPGNHPWGTGDLVKTGGNFYDWNITVADIVALTRKFSVELDPTGHPGVYTTYNDGGVSFTAPVDPADAGGPDISSLRVWLRATDRAGNQFWSFRDIWINPWGDIPVATIETPKPGPAPDRVAETIDPDVGYGGSLYVTGSALDNTYINEVVYRIIETDMDANTEHAVVMNGADVDDTVDSLYTAADASILVVSGPYAGKQGWMRAAITRNDTRADWNFFVNGGGEIKTDYAANINGPTKVKVQVMAFDSILSDKNQRGQMGPVDYMTLYFSQGQPIFDPAGWKVEPLEKPGIFWDLSNAQRHNIRGSFRISGIAIDTSTTGTPQISQVRWRGEESSIWTTMTVTPANNLPFSLELDSQTLWNKHFAGTSGAYTVYFEITGALGTAQQSVTVNIDNFVPLADGAALTNPKAAGTDYWFTGEALDIDPGNHDNPPVRNLNKVVAWFTRDAAGTTFIRLTDGVEASAPGDIDSATEVITVEALTGRTTAVNGSAGSAAYPNPKAAEHQDDVLADWRIIINENTQPDKTVWTGSAGQKTWSFKVDTTKLKDGAMFLHYLIYDEAGNASYYNEPLMVMNNSPMLDTIAISTNPRRLGNSAAAEGRAEFTAGVANLYKTGFVARNYLKFEVTPQEKGNKPLHYRLAYVTRTATTTLAAGKIYTIGTSGTANWEGYGAPNSLADTHFMALQGVNLSAYGASAYEYTEVAALKQEQLSQDDYGTKTFEYTGDNFDNAVGKIYDGDAFFLLKVWDSVPGNGEHPEAADEAAQNYVFDIIGLTVAATADSTPPTAAIYDLNPYAETGVVNSMATAANPLGIGQNAGRAGIYNKSTNVRVLEKSGHIEPRTGSTVLRNNETQVAGFTNDSVSGKVILRGRAWDQVLLGSISLKFGTEPAFTILERKADGKLAAAAGVEAWAVDEIHWKDGHTVEWAYAWDSEAKPSGVVVGSVAITVTATDWDTGTVTPAAKTVDRVPYITGFTRNANYVTGRSKQGWYSFSRGETVTARGYNLKDSGNSAMTLNTWAWNTANPPVQVAKDIVLTAAGTQGNHEVSFTMIDSASTPANVNSGKITLTTSGSVAAMNNRNSDEKSWNKENWSYTRGSDLWTDTRGVHIWESREETTVGTARTYFGAAASSNKAEYVSMSLNRRTGAIWGAWSVYSATSVFAAANTVDTITTIAHSGDPYRETDIVNGTNETSAATTTNWPLAYNFLRDYDQNAEAGIYVSTGLSANGIRKQSSGLAHESFVNHRIAGNTAGNGYHVVHSHLVTRNLYYFNSSNTANRWRALDGPAANVTGTGSAAASAAAGLWSAIDVVTGGYPVVAYHDAANDTVRIVYASVSDPYDATQWTRKVLLDPADPNFSGSGSYISIAVDRLNSDAAKKNMVHLAFYNSVHDTVIYAYGKVGATFTSEVVDTGFSGGQWTDIALDADGNPWITYQDANRVNNTDGARIAYRNADLYGTSGGGWEAMSVPTVGDTAGSGYNVADGRLNIEAWPPANCPPGINYSTGTTWPSWNAAVGYQSDKFRIAYYIKPATF